MEISEQDVQKQLTNLLTDHGDLDAAIDALQIATASDQTQLQRLKKKKLRLKDQISELRCRLRPDVIA